MIVKILLALLGVVALVLLIAAFQPDDYSVTRSTTINAAPGVVFAQVNDLRRWDGWSPWAKLDPTMKQSYSGAPSGVGAESSWDGDKKVGSGRMTITESVPTEKVGIRLDFLKPFAATSQSTFTFRGEGKTTAVNWTMTGARAYPMKVMCLFVSLDKMMGGDFERGLANLKRVCEGGTSP